MPRLMSPLQESVRNFLSSSSRRTRRRPTVHSTVSVEMLEARLLLTRLVNTGIGDYSEDVSRP